MELILLALGLAVGSFLNVLADRLPRGESPLFSRSYCDHCRQTLRWFELIPVVSFLLQQGKCKRCHQRLSLQYPIVELGTGLGFVMLYRLANLGGWQALALIFLFSSFVVITVSDLKYRIIPDSMLVVLVIAAILQAFFSPSDVSFANRILAAAGAGGFFLFLWWVTRGRGMGFGDVKLSAILGMLLGFPQIVVACYTAFLTGAVVAVILVLAGKKSLKSRMAFGPFLIAGAFTSLLFGSQVLAVWRVLL